MAEGVRVDPYGRELGVGASGVVRLASNVADGETVTVGSKVYEFDLTDDGVTSGRVTIGDAADRQAYAVLYSGVTNKEITVTADDAGPTGDAWSVEIETGATGAGNEDRALAAVNADDPDPGAIMVTLGTDSNGDLDATKNTATLIAAAIDAIDGVTAEVTNGTGAAVVSAALAEASLSRSQPGDTASDLVSSINANDPLGLRAVKLSANAVAIFTRGTVPAGTVAAMSETMAGSNNTVESAVDGGSVGTRVVGGARVPSTVEVGVGFLAIPLPFSPTTVQVQVRVTSTGVVKAWDGAASVVAASGATPGYVLLDNSGSTDWAATDTVYWMAGE